MYKLTSNPNIVLRLIDKTKIPFDELHPDYLAYKDWLEQGNAPEPSDEVKVQDLDPKLKGVLFEGVWCSATKEDQNGLMAVLTAFQLQGVNFIPTIYEFANGTKLELNKYNIQGFIETWLPFRQSFFISKS